MSGQPNLAAGLKELGWRILGINPRRSAFWNSASAAWLLPPLLQGVGLVLCFLSQDSEGNRALSLALLTLCVLQAGAAALLSWVSSADILARPGTSLRVMDGLVFVVRLYLGVLMVWTSLNLFFLAEIWRK